jgi:hypothetical protein
MYMCTYIIATLICSQLHVTAMFVGPCCLTPAVDVSSFLFRPLAFFMRYEVHVGIHIDAIASIYYYM